MNRIIVAGNGPSAYSDAVRSYVNGTSLFVHKPDRLFRTNYFYLTDGDPFRYRVSDWFICEDVSDCRAVQAINRFGRTAQSPPTIWLPGVNSKVCSELESKHLSGCTVRLQRFVSNLPLGCRWHYDPAPERPLMGSFALAVAVSMQPAELMVCGQDLFQHPSKVTHAGAEHETRAWQSDFNKAYLANTHRNHRLSGDLKYIKAALQDYNGKLTVIGSVMCRYFKDEFSDRKEWQWLEG